MKKKLILILTLLILSSSFAFSQEDDTEHNFTKAEGFADFIHSLDFVIQTEPGVYLNLESTLVSAPSPILYPLTIGIIWPNYTRFAVQPTLSFFSTEWLWYENKALPAEIENRTATSLSFLLNVPLVVSLYFKKSKLQIMPGISFLAQFGFLSNGVKASDSGYSGSAAGDVELINKYFWDNLNFLYISTGFSWLFNMYATENSWVKIGPVINIQIPLRYLTEGTNLQGALISAGLKLSL